MNCLTCKTPLPPPPWFRADLCPKCSASLHSCVYCTFYAPHGHNRNLCREPQADRVTDKERANFCDYFRPTGLSSAEAPPDKAREAAKAAFDALFKK